MLRRKAVKTCTYCGRQNPDEAAQCPGCGQTGFVAAEATPVASARAALKPSHLLWRVCLALCVGIGVWVLATWVAWQQTRDAKLLYAERFITQMKLEDVDKAIKRYRQHSSAPPSSLAELQSADNPLDIETNGQILDGWQRPFHYSCDGTNYQVLSYGADGKPGGQGLDADLSSRVPNAEGSLPTLGQFLSEKNSHAILRSCRFCGMLTFVLGLFLIKPPELSPRGLGIAAVKLLATIVGTVFVASIISVLHVPSGH